MSQHVPRFIPTLTEIVDPASLKTVVECRRPELQTLVQQVQRQIQPVFERRLQEEFDQWQRSLMGQQWETMRLRLQHDLNEMVQQAVADHLGQVAVSGSGNSAS
ncbi:MAG: hypothetical protein PHH58_06105 [Rhodoferax sp.]|nr:hypothetical protein [Rhodoferax sp.]